MSCDAYDLLLMKRALARPDGELFGHRARYEARARVLAARLLDPTRLPVENGMSHLPTSQRANHMAQDDPITYERALASVIADPETSYRLRQSIQQDPVLSAAAAARDEVQLLDRLKQLCEEDARGAWQAMPTSSAMIINESSRD